MLHAEKHINWMRIALNQANLSTLKGEIPVGAVLVKNDKAIAVSHNLTLNNIDPTSHAEINVIRLASREIGNHRLNECTLYVTLEPCAMCYGAIVQSRIERVVFGAYDSKTGMCGSCYELSRTKCFNHVPKIIGGVLEHECSVVLQNFFKKKRD